MKSDRNKTQLLNPLPCFLTFGLNRLKLNIALSTSDEGRIFCHSERQRRISSYKAFNVGQVCPTDRTQKGRGENSEVFFTHFAGQRKCAFTLAEVLITLGIIGVVVAMTLPAVINQYKEKQTVVALKKAYSILNQAYLLTISKEGEPQFWDWVNNENSVVESIVKNFKTIKSCSEHSKCFADDYKNLSGKILTNSIKPTNGYQYSLADGVSLVIVPWVPQCTSSCGDGKLANSFCGYILVDINGDKKPNTLGKDYFGFLMTKYGIYPAGMPEANSTCGSLQIHCNINNSNVSNGLGCTNWVILKENMLYLKKQVSY